MNVIRDIDVSDCTRYLDSRMAGDNPMAGFKGRSIGIIGFGLSERSCLGESRPILIISLAPYTIHP